MRELDEQFGDRIQIIGVHSGKFSAERVTSHILDASLRLDAIHPTVNDRQFRVWRSYAVQAWPTLAVISTTGKVVGMQAGEFTADRIAGFIQQQLDAPAADRATAPPVAASESSQKSSLRYPGKVAIDGNRMAIADSGHHRILIGMLNDAGSRLRITQIVGGAEGYADGASPRFTNPQGLCFRGDELLCCDAGSHTVRSIDVPTGHSRTIAGTGVQRRSDADARQGAITSPWDIVAVGDALYVAAAGRHHILRIGADGAVTDFAGSGAEELHDASLREAAFAQPMGLCAHDDVLYVADSESSAIRILRHDGTGDVSTLVGTGLFDFGDTDGAGDAVRLQHPQGVASDQPGHVLIADSYNGALKWLDVGTREVRTWCDGFGEPGGVALTPDAAWVADTNRHRIARVNRTTGVTTDVEIVW